MVRGHDAGPWVRGTLEKQAGSDSGVDNTRDIIVMARAFPEVGRASSVAVYLGRYPHKARAYRQALPTQPAPVAHGPAWGPGLRRGAPTTKVTAGSNPAA
jgi:hypothetical protein